MTNAGLPHGATAPPRRLRRSELSTPGSSAKMIAKAAGSDADMVFLDLEDSVAPVAKLEARGHVAKAFRTLDWGSKIRAVRINGLFTPWGRDDVAHLIREAGDKIDCLVVPKVDAPEDVRRLDELMTVCEEQAGLQRRIGLEVLIESVRGLINVEEIATSSPRMETVIFGHGDLSADQGMRVETVGGRGDYSGGDLWYYPRMKIILAARAAGIDAIDGPFAAFRDVEGYRIESGRAALLGCGGKWCIHPSQVTLANEVFSPRPDELARARRVVAAYEEAEAAGLGAVALDGEMIDAATARILRTVVDLAEMIDRKDGAGAEGG
jgi:citrate lyase subunit beta/citryl-CoA lyase